MIVFYNWGEKLRLKNPPQLRNDKHKDISIMNEKIMTLHPQGKAGVNIDEAKYNVIRTAILTSIVDNGGEIAFKDLATAVANHLSLPFAGSIGWYTTTVKLDLEARGEIERIPKASPQRLRLKNG
jgi:hypothetical protein